MPRILTQIPVFAACIALFCLMVLTFCDVVLRSAFNAPIEAATEVTRILMAIIVFSVLPILSARGEHISVDLTDILFHRAGLNRVRDALMHLICGIALIWPLQRVWILAERARDYGDVTEYLNIPQFYIGWFIAASIAVTILAKLTVGVLHIVKPSVVEGL